MLAANLARFGLCRIWMATWLLAPCAPVSAQQAVVLNKYLVAAPDVPSPVPVNHSFSNITAATTFTPYAYVIQVNASTATTQNWTISDILPASFMATSCQISVNGVAQPGCSVGSNSWTAPSVPTGSGNMTLAIYGTYNGNQIGAITNIGNATIGSMSASGSVTTAVAYIPPKYNIEVKKITASNGLLGTSQTYTLTLKNTSSVSVSLNGLVHLFDGIHSASALNGVASNFTCSATIGSSCVNIPTMPQTFTLNNSTHQLFGVSGTTGGNLGPGGTMTLTYDLKMTSSATCGALTVNISNTANLSLGVASGNFPDANPSDNISSTSTSLQTGLSPCTQPAYSVTKKVLSQAHTPGSSVVEYEIVMTNNSAAPMNLKYYDYVNGVQPIPTTFSANVISYNTTPLSLVSSINLSNVGGAQQTLLTGPSAGLSIPAGQIFKLVYKVKYIAPCPQRPGPINIRNVFHANISGNNDYQYADIAMVPLPECPLTISKILDPTTPGILPFGSSLGTYTIKWTNTSSNTLFVGRVMDTLSISDSLYASVPVSYSGLTCTGSGVTVLPTLTNTGTATVSPNPSQPQQGQQILNLSNLTFSAGATLTCSYALKADRPLPTQSKCMSSGSPKLVNLALSDPDPYYGTWLTPASSARVDKGLPLCVDAILQKTAEPQTVLPGDPIAWTITAYNNAPVNSGGSPAFTITDSIPAALGTASNHNCAPVSTPGLIGACSNTGTSISETVLSIPAQSAVVQSFTTSSPSTAPTAVTNTAVFVASPDTYLRGGQVNQATASITTAWPRLTKTFSPATISPTGTAQLIFTVSNLNHAPAVSNMAFTDTLSNGMLIAGPVVSTCAGAAPVAVVGSSTLSWAGGGLAAGQSSCSISVPIKLSNLACGKQYNNAYGNNVQDGVKLDTTQAIATLTARCSEEAVIKVCKVAGENIKIGTPFSFHVAGNTVSVPAGPAPGGYCVPVPVKFPVGSTVNVQEQPSPFSSVTEILVQPKERQARVDTANGSVELILGHGVNEATFHNKAKKGFLEICKSAPINTASPFTFLINEGKDPIIVPVGACSPAIEVTAGSVTITEVAPYASIAACDTFPAERCLVKSKNTVVALVHGGDIAAQTVINIKNTYPPFTLPMKSPPKPGQAPR